jgi:predicted DNA-binding protein with PD1-like motif
VAQDVESAVSSGGRVIVGRLHTGIDLIEGLEAACDEHGF